MNELRVRFQTSKEGTGIEGDRHPQEPREEMGFQGPGRGREEGAKVWKLRRLGHRTAGAAGRAWVGKAQASLLPESQANHESKRNFYLGSKILLSQLVNIKRFRHFN